MTNLPGVLSWCRRAFAIFVGLLATFGMAGLPASAATAATVPVSMTFNEPKT